MDHWRVAVDKCRVNVITGDMYFLSVYAFFISICFFGLGNKQLLPFFLFFFLV